MKRKISVLSAFVILLSLLFTNLILPVYASDAVSFTMPEVSATAGSTVTVTVGINQTVYKLCGLRFYIGYDSSKVMFEDKSTKILQSGIESGETNKGNANDGKIYFTYVGSVSSPITLKKGDIASFRFTVTDSASESIPLTLYIEECLQGKLQNVELAAYKVESKINLTASAVASVESLISAIGTVSYPESQDAIYAARKAYNALNTAEKNAVANIDTLTAAEAEFQRLKNQQTSAEAKAAAESYRQRNSAILSKNAAYEGENALTLADAAAIESAISDYDSQTASVKQLLNTERNYLKKLENYVPILESVKAAEETLASFYDNYQYFMELTVDNVTTSELTGLGQAKQHLENMKATFDDIPEWISKNTDSVYKHITDLYNRAVELNTYENAESTKEYLDFMDEHGKWLTATTDSITKDDLVDLSLAKYAFEQLSAEAKALVGEKLYDIICELLEYAEDLPAEVETVTDTEYVTKTDTVYVDRITEAEAEAEGQAKKTLVNVLGEEISILVWILLISLGVLLVLLAAGTAVRLWLKNKYKRLSAVNDFEEVSTV